VKHAFAVALATAALVAVTGCAASHRAVVSAPLPSLLHRTPPSPTALRFSAASNRRFAQEDAQKLIRIFVLPRGARLVGRVPRSAPPRFRNGATATRFLPGIAVTRKIWIVHEPPGRVFRFLQAHAHPRPRPEVSVRGKNNGIRLRRRLGFYPFPPISGRSWERWLSIDMAALSSGRTVVVAQAAEAWIHPSHSVLLTRAVKRIDILSRLGSQHPNVIVHIRRPYDVGSIVSLVNGLGLADAEPVVCAAVLFGGPTVTLRFRSASGELLARATVRDTLGAGRSEPCNPLQLTVRGRKAPLLIGADLLLRIQRTFGLDLAPPLPREVSACLSRQHGWKVRSVTPNELVDRVQRFPPQLTAARKGRRWRITFHHTGKVTLDRAGPHALMRCLRPGPRYPFSG
jgi:hypothetical protein